VTTTTFSFFFLRLSIWKIASIASCLCSSLKSTAVANKFGSAFLKLDIKKFIYLTIRNIYMYKNKLMKLFLKISFKFNYIITCKWII